MPGMGMLEIIYGLRNYSRALNDALKAQTSDYTPVLLTHPPHLRAARLSELSRLSKTLDYQWLMLLPIFEAIKSTKEELRRQRSLCHSARSPVSSIPHEILSKIFLLAQDSSNSDNSASDSDDTSSESDDSTSDSDDSSSNSVNSGDYLPEAMIVAIRISQVCRDWRRVAIHEKSLWTAYRVSHLMDLKKITPYLERCTNEPFDLHVGVGWLTQDDALYPISHPYQASRSPVVSKLMKQLRKLVCNRANDVNGLYQVLSDLDGLCGSNQVWDITFSSLETIHVLSGCNVVGESVRLDFRGLQFPALKLLNLVDTGILPTSYPKLIAVETLYLRGRRTLLETDLYELIWCTPKIKELSITDVCTQRDQNRMMPSSCPSLLALETVELVHTDEYIACRVLGSFICPKLTTLSMSRIHYKSAIDNNPWTAASVGQAHLPLVLSHSIHKTITHAPMLVNLKLHAPPEVLKALIHAISTPLFGITGIKPPQSLKSLSIGFENCENRETGEDEAHTREIGREIGILLVQALNKRMEYGCIPLCELFVDSCMIGGCLCTVARRVEVRACDCCETDGSNSEDSNSGSETSEQ